MSKDQAAATTKELITEARALISSENANELWRMVEKLCDALEQCHRRAAPQDGLVEAARVTRLWLGNVDHKRTCELFASAKDDAECPCGLWALQTQVIAALAEMEKEG